MEGAAPSLKTLLWNIIIQSLNSSCVKRQATYMHKICIVISVIALLQ
jgi:hypothetical protein